MEGLLSNSYREFETWTTWVEAELREQAAVAQVEARMGIREGDLKGLVTGEQLRTLNVYTLELVVRLRRVENGKDQW